jgi:phosphatidylglycerol lysyltransferase
VALARRLFAAVGTNNVGYFALLGDKELWADPQGRGVVAFRRHGGTALVAGDPLAAPADLPAVLDGFLAHCHAQGWTPAFYQSLGATLPQYRARGLRALAIGREALIDLPSFTLRGKQMANVRHSVTHAERAGLRVRLQSAAGLDPATRAELVALSRAWLAAKGGREMGFTMGGLTPDGRPLPGSRVAVAYDGVGQVQAFLTVVPAGGGRGWMLDLMRRHHTAVSGSMDLLIARTAEALRAEGCALFSLSLAPLASTATEDEDAPALVRWARRLLYEKMQGAYNYRSLFNYKRKFNVRWETRYLVYAGDASLPAALFATARAHLPSGLNAVPSLSPARLLAWVGARPVLGGEEAA